MCGIVGYIGNRAMRNVLDGLKSLEYRGYDSAGVALIKDGYAPFVIKSEGRIGALEMKLNGHDDVSAPVAIGHTRWATHGKPSETNAHPHVAGNIALVHNGIIENYLELKEWLKKVHGRAPVSETDTEIIALLIDVMPDSTLRGKFSNAVRKLEGAYALAVVSSDSPGEILVARQKSPLVVGLTDDAAVIASDIHAILPHTNKVHVLQDGETAIVGVGLFCVQNEIGGLIKRDPLEIPWSVAQTSKGEFDTFMDKEIHEQPIAIYDTMIKNNWAQVAERIFKIFDDNMILNVTLTACGTSLHACMVGAMMFEGISGMRSNAKLASELEASASIITPNDLVVAISQSGETADTLQAIRHAKSKGAKVISIVNTMGSSIERESDYTIHMAAGPEISVASTKAFVAQLSVLAMMSAAIRGISWGNFHAGKMFVDAQHGLYQCADEMDFIFQQEDKIKDISTALSTSKSILYLGRGLNVPVALEGALKLKEISYIHAEGFAAGELKHGPIALIEDGTPVIALAVNSPTYKKMLSNIEEAKTRGAKIIAIATDGNEEIEKLVDEVIFIPDVSEVFVPLMAVVPLQLLAMYTASCVGADIDKPRNLAKSVTVE